MEGAMAMGFDVNDSTGQPTMDSPSVRPSIRDKWGRVQCGFSRSLGLARVLT